MNPPDIFKDGVLCLRLVEIERDDGGFEVLFIHARSNVEALSIGFAMQPEARRMTARPVTE
jgi:hypothetical protein